MARTYEALMRAEKEARKRSVTTLPIKPVRQNGTKVNVLEEYRRLRHNILRINSGKEIKTLLFSSSTEGEGSSTVLVNFAIMLASEGGRVLVVDANLRKPSLHHVFNVEKGNGLAELILKRGVLASLVKRTQYDHLSLITAGKFESGPLVPRGPKAVDSGRYNPSVLFESKVLESLIQEMRAAADWVLFDSPAINAFNDAIALGSKVDGVVMVVEAEKVRWEVAQRAKTLLEKGNANVIGAVLNKRHYYIPEWLYKTL
jgi:capsular exopolysaccharide synthesis family protein